MKGSSDLNARLCRVWMPCMVNIWERILTNERTGMVGLDQSEAGKQGGLQRNVVWLVHLRWGKGHALPYTPLWGKIKTDNVWIKKILFICLFNQNLERGFCLEFHLDCIKGSLFCELWKTGEWFLPMVHYFPRYLTVSEYVCTCLRQRLDQSQASIGDHQPIRAQETAWTPELSNERPVRVTVDQWEARKLRRAVWHYPGAQCEARVWSVNTAPDVWGMVEWHAPCTVQCR